MDRKTCIFSDNPCTAKCDFNDYEEPICNIQNARNHGHLSETFTKCVLTGDDCPKSCTYHFDPKSTCEVYKNGKHSAKATAETPPKELINFISLLGPSSGTNRPTHCPSSGGVCMAGCTSLTNRFCVCRLSNAVDFASDVAADEFYALAHQEYKDLKDFERDCYIGFPDTEKLDHAAGVLTGAFHETCYLVGSATYTKAYRDVDVRMIMSDEKYDKLFGRTGISPFWSLLCTSISYWMRHATGLPVDFQIQRQSRCNGYQGKRRPLGMGYRVVIDKEYEAPWLVEKDEE